MNIFRRYRCCVNEARIENLAKRLEYSGVNRKKLLCHFSNCSPPLSIGFDSYERNYIVHNMTPAVNSVTRFISIRHPGWSLHRKNELKTGDLAFENFCR